MVRAGAFFWVCATAAADLSAVALAKADVLLLRDGQRLEGLVVEADDETVLVRHGAGRATISRRVPRKEIASLQLSPPEVWTVREQAWRAEREGEANEAAACWQIVCGLRPESAEDQLRRAESLRRSGRLEEAAAAAAAAGKIDPKSGRAILEQGECRLLAGDARRAAELALDYLKLGAERPAPGHWLLGRAFEGTNMADDAIAAYLKALSAEPGHGEALERLVHLYCERYAAAEAEAAARAFVRAAPGQRAGRTALGKAIYRQGRHAEAVDALQEATALGGPGYDRARVFLLTARARAQGRDPALALKPGERDVAAELDPALRREKP